MEQGENDCYHTRNALMFVSSAAIFTSHPLNAIAAPGKSTPDNCCESVVILFQQSDTLQLDFDVVSRQD
jgi:hypothetical protein